MGVTDAGDFTDLRDATDFADFIEGAGVLLMGGSNVGRVGRICFLSVFLWRRRFFRGNGSGIGDLFII